APLLMPALTPEPEPKQTIRTDKYSTAAFIGLLLITIAGAWLRWRNIGARSLWVDEGSSVAIAHLDWWNFLRLLWRREANMSRYYLLLCGWLHFGSSEALIRGLSVLFGVLTIPAIYALARKLGSRATGVTAAALLALNVYHIRYSQEARAYALAVLLVTLSSWSLLVLGERPSAKWRWTYTLSSALSVYAHFYSLLVLISQGMWLCARRPVTPIASEIKEAIRNTLFGLIPFLIFVVTTGAGPLAWLARPGFRELKE